ncbi:hypothetical protein PF003_g24928 [Phytophthora fragariae]|nr:hypothetical protein PF003_g24928 [Phytophthora fragariae]
MNLVFLALDSAHEGSERGEEHDVTEQRGLISYRADNLLGGDMLLGLMLSGDMLLDEDLVLGSDMLLGLMLGGDMLLGLMLGGDMLLDEDLAATCCLA